jgi:hypothetical protein
LIISPENLIQLVDISFSSEPQRNLYKNYILGLVQRGLPPILSLQHLSDEVGVSKSTLVKMCFSAHSFYRTFSIPKRSGGMRRIDAPLPSLAKVQTWLSENLISALPINSTVVCAYKKECSIKDHVTRHVSKPYLLKLDIDSFFPSISTHRVAYLLANCGYHGALAMALAHLLTLNGSLPQGAPSSPGICNAVMIDVDNRLLDFADLHGLVYSRYADDLAFSGNAIEARDICQIEGILETSGYRLNPRKTKLFFPGMHGRLLTGLVINGNTVRVPRSTRRAIRQAVYYMERYFLSDLGIGDSCQSFGAPSRSYAHFDPIGIERVIGQLLFWKWIEPNCQYVSQALEKLRICQQRLLEVAG